MVIMRIYVAKAHTFLPVSPRSGVVNSSTPAIANGMAIHNRYGRYLPHFVVVRSAMIPIIGSETASQIFVTRNSSAARPRSRPNTFV